MLTRKTGKYMPKKHDQNVVIIETLDFAFLPLACQKAAEGQTVFFFSADKQVLQQQKVREYLATSQFFDLSSRVFHHSLNDTSVVSANENLDCIYRIYFKNSATIPITVRLLDSPNTEDMYKKEVLLLITNLYYTQLRINEFVWGLDGTVEFYPQEYAEIHSGPFSLLSGKVRVVTYSSIRVCCISAKRRAKEYVNYLYPLYILLKKVKGITRETRRRPVFHLSINANIPALFSYNYHYIRFLVDAIYGIKRDQVIFVDESFRDVIPQEFRDNGFAYLNFLQGRVAISGCFLLQIIRHFVPAWWKCVLFGILEKRPVMKTSRLILTDYIRWNLLMDTYDIKNHVTILLPDTISKDLILTRHGTRTWYVYPDNFSADYFSGRDESIPQTILYTFMHADTAIIFGDKIRRFFSYNQNHFQRYIPVGVLSAQHIREIRQGMVVSPIRKLVREKKLPQKIIGVFDTSFVDDGPVKVHDGISFGKDILRLLDDFPEIGVVFKEKKFITLTPDLVPVYTELEQHPRCLFIRKTKDECIFSSEVIAVSDLVISAAYTSTSAEALASRTRALYYDIAGKDLGENFYFNRYPNFVAHSYEELKRLVQLWLYDVSPEEFNQFLEMYVKGEIDPYLDCHAIDRLQNLLRYE